MSPFPLVKVLLLACVGQAVDVNLFTLHKNSEYLHDWVHYHGSIFGYDKLTIVDTDSSPHYKEELKKMIKLGVTVNFQNFMGFRDKQMQMTANMLLRKHLKSFLVPLDIDEFIVAVNYDEDALSNFSMNKEFILEKFDKLPIPDNEYAGKKYKFNTFDVIDCSKPMNLNDPPQAGKLYNLNSFVEDKATITRCTAKTFYYSEGFTSTDHGNHYGSVYNESRYCFQKVKCKKCYYQFMKSGLGLLHYSLSAMNYNEIKEKMLQRLSVLPQFIGHNSVKNCSKMRHNTHYCIFNALLLRNGDEYMMKKQQEKRNSMCNKRVFTHSEPLTRFDMLRNIRQHHQGKLPASGI